jgi:hypothetical protein
MATMPTAMAQQPLSYCVGREKVAIATTVSVTLRKKEASSLPGRKSPPLFDASSSYVTHLGGVPLRIANFPSSSGVSAALPDLESVRQLGATSLLNLDVALVEYSVSGFTDDTRGSIRSYSLLLRSSVLDISSGSTLAEIEEPMVYLSGGFPEEAIQAYIGDPAYGFTDALTKVFRAACANIGVRPAPRLQARPTERPEDPSSHRNRSRSGQGNDDLANPDPVVEAGRHRAVVIGISSYQRLLQNSPTADRSYSGLKYADHDAIEMGKFLGDKRASGANWEIFSLLNQHATHSAVENAVASVMDAAQPGDVIVFYFSGHGDHARGRLNDVYLLTYDTDPDDVTTGIHLNHIYDRAIESKALQVILIIDACGAGSVRGKGAGDDVEMWRKSTENKIGKMRIIMTSGSGGQKAGESDELKHGIFTYYLLEGLKNRALPAISGLPGTSPITIQMLFKYASEKVADYTSSRLREYSSIQFPSIGGDLGKPNEPARWPFGVAR